MSYNNVGHLITSTIIKLQHFATLHQTILHYTYRNFTPSHLHFTTSQFINHRLGYTECPRRNVKYFGRVFLMWNYTDITQNAYIQSWTVTEIMVREKCGHLIFPRSIRPQLYREPPLPVVIWLLAGAYVG